MTKPYLLIKDSFIYGNPQGLVALKGAIDLALLNETDPDNFARCTVWHTENMHTNYCVRQDDEQEIEALLEE